MGARDGAKYGDLAIKGGVKFFCKNFPNFVFFSDIFFVPLLLLRLFPGTIIVIFFHYFLVPIRLSVCALRSGRTERRMTAGFKGVSL